MADKQNRGVLRYIHHLPGVCVLIPFSADHLHHLPPPTQLHETKTIEKITLDFTELLSKNDKRF